MATNPENGREAVLASTGSSKLGSNADRVGTLYTIKTDFRKMTGTLKIVYDGDMDPSRRLRSPDNLDWTDDGWIYVQEDMAADTDDDGRPIFGAGAANPYEASIVRINPENGEIQRVAEIDRTAVLDPSTFGTAFDRYDGKAGKWETSGILDVSTLFGRKKGTLFILDVRAHGIKNQNDLNGDSEIDDEGLVEGGQLLFLDLSADRSAGRGSAGKLTNLPGSRGQRLP